jgi:integrase
VLPNALPNPLLDLIERYETGSQLVSKSRHQARQNATIMRRLTACCGAVVIEQIDRAAVARYLGGMAQAGASPKTIKNHKSGIGSFFTWLDLVGLLPARDALGRPWADPTQRMPTPRVHRIMPYYLTEPEIAEVLTLAWRFGIWPEVSLAMATGMRRQELARLQWIDVDWFEQSVAVVKAKGCRPRAIPINDQALAALAAQRRHSGLLAFVFPARKTFRGCRRRAPEFFDRERTGIWWDNAIRPIREAVPKFQQVRKGCGRGWHLFRHTFASRCVQAGIDIRRVQEWLGHANVSTTERYAHLAAGYDARIERIVPPSFRPPGSAEQPEPFAIEVLPLFKGAV